MSDALKGTVKWFNDAKGYGFIQPAEGDKAKDGEKKDEKKSPSEKK